MKFCLPCTRQAWNGGGTSILEIFNSTGQGTDQLALALQPDLLGAGGWRGDLQSSLCHQNPSVNFLYDLKIKQSIAAVNHNHHFAQIKAHKFAVCRPFAARIPPAMVSLISPKGQLLLQQKCSSFTRLMNAGFLQRMHRNLFFLPTVELKEQLPIA